MIAWLANYLVRVLLKNEIIETDKIEIYQYGYEIIISTIITFLIVLISGIILDCLPAAILYFLIFAVMRQICGGYHAQHYWSCNTLFAVVTVSMLLLFKFFPSVKLTSASYTTISERSGTTYEDTDGYVSHNYSGTGITSAKGYHVAGSSSVSTSR